MAYTRRDFSDTAVATTLNGGINASVETFAIASATGWPSGTNGDFFVLIESEVLRCQSRSGTTVTVLSGGRGAAGTSATTHASGVAVYLVHTGTIDDDEANYTVAETVGKITAAGQILIGDGANSLAALDVKTSGRIIVGNGTTGVSVAVSGDATLAASGALTIANDAVTYAKLQNVTVTDRLLGRDTAAAGDVEELTVGGGVEFTGSGGIQRSALTGDVTASAGSNTTDIAAGVVGVAELATAVAGNGLTGGGGSALAVNVDASTIEINADTLRVKDLGVTTAKIAANAVDATKLAAALPQGWIATSTPRATSQTGVVNADITGTSITWTAVANRKYLYVPYNVGLTPDTNGDRWRILVVLDGVEMGLSGASGVAAVSADFMATGSARFSTTAGSHTIKLYASRAAGSGLLDVTGSTLEPVFADLFDMGGT